MPQARRRGTRRNAHTPLPPLLEMQSLQAGPTADTLKITFRNILSPRTGNGIATKVSVQGIPKVLRISVGDYPIGAVAVNALPPYVLLQYAAPDVEGAQEFGSSLWDPALRGESGGYVVPFHDIIPV